MFIFKGDELLPQKFSFDRASCNQISATQLWILPQCVNFKVYLEMCDAMIICLLFFGFFLPRNKKQTEMQKEKKTLISQHARERNSE